MEKIKDFLDTLAHRLSKRGAEDMDLVYSTTTGHSADVRLGAVECLESATTHRLSLRAIQGKKAAVVTTNTIDGLFKGENDTLDRLFAMLAVVPEDDHLQRPPAHPLDTKSNPLFCDTHEETPSDLIARAKAVEEKARATKGITDSEGSSATFERSRTFLRLGNGFFEETEDACYSTSVVLLAGANDQRQRDGYGASSLQFSTLKSVEEIAEKATHRALRRLNSRKVKTGTYPVLFENTIASSLVGIFLSAIQGDLVAKGMSFLKDALGRPTFSSLIQIVDDPHVPFTFGATRFDGEGLPTKKTALVTDGILHTFLHNLRSAALLDTTSSAHATLPIGGAPGISAHHIMLMPGTHAPDALMRNMGTGLLVTELMGSTGINTLTGDYSVGASGLWIEKGEITHPVEGLTIAGRLQDMFLSMQPASDIEILGSVNAPSLLVEGMTISGT